MSVSAEMAVPAHELIDGVRAPLKRDVVVDAPFDTAMPRAAAAVKVKRGNVFGVQYLRAVAAMMVAYYHLKDQLPAYVDFLTFRHGFDAHRLTAGVDIFFIISGFIMVITSTKLKPGEFALKRFLRLAPMYWLVTGVLIVMFLMHPGFFRATSVAPEYIIKSLLFIPYANPAQNGAVVPLLVPGWTLNIEMFFYAVFAVLLFAPPRYRLRTAAIVLGAVYLLPRLFVGLKSAPMTVYADPRILEFVAGMAIGSAYLKDSVRLTQREAWLLIVAGFLGLLVCIRDLPQPVGSWSGELLFDMLPACAVVYGVIALEVAGGIRFHKLAALMGDASYSIYLTHIFAFGIIRAIWTQCIAGPADAVHALAFCFASLASVCVMGIGIYFMIERPIHRYFNGVFFRK